MKRAAKKKKRSRSFSFATIPEMFFALVMIPLGLAAAQGLGFAEAENAEEWLAFLVLTEFLLLSLTTFLRAKARRYRNQITERRRLDFIFSGLFLACAVALFIQPTLPVMTIAGVVFMISLIPSRVLSILRNRKWLNILANAVFILLVLFSMWDSEPGPDHVGDLCAAAAGSAEGYRSANLCC